MFPAFIQYLERQGFFKCFSDACLGHVIYFLKNYYCPQTSTKENINIIKYNVKLVGLFEINSSHHENTKDTFVNTVPLPVFNEKIHLLLISAILTVWIITF